MGSSDNQNGVIAASSSQKLEWVRPQISSLEALDTQGSGKASRPTGERTIVEAGVIVQSSGPS